MTPVPIAYVIPWMSIGGAQRHLVEVLRLLDRRRFRPLLVCMTTRRGDAAALLDDVRALDVPILDAGVEDGANALARPATVARMVAIGRELRRRGVQVVHSYLFPANWFGTLAARLAGIPVAIASKRSMDVYPRARDRWACRLVNGLADCVTAVAGNVRDHVHREEGCPLDKMVVIPNGVDAARIAAAAAEVDGRAALGVPRGGKLVGTVTRLIPKRGHAQLLEAAALVARQEPDARIVVIGDGPLRPALEAEAQGLGLNGAIRFAGAIPRAWRLLRELDVFVLSSVLEGMSNAMLEAMAAGRPVVATRVGGNAEVVVDGETGFLVPPGDAGAMAAAILRLLRDPLLARQMGQAGRKRVDAEFTLARMVERMEGLYEELLRRRRAA